MGGLAPYVVQNKMDFALERGLMLTCPILRLPCLLPLGETLWLWTLCQIGLITASPCHCHSAVHLIASYNNHLIAQSLWLLLPLDVSNSWDTAPASQYFSFRRCPMSLLHWWKFWQLDRCHITEVISTSLTTSDVVLISNQLEGNRAPNSHFLICFLGPLLAPNIH